MWYAGLDWANDHHDVVIIDEAGHQVASKRVSHTKAGVEELIRLLESILGSSDKEQLACVIETNRGLLITALLEAGFRVYPVNPKRSIGAEGHREPRPTALMPICWPSWQK